MRHYESANPRKRRDAPSGSNTKLAIDYDATIFKKDGQPVENSAEAIKWLSDLGYDLYICTSREEGGWEEMRTWLRNNGFPDLRITNKKELKTIAYIDDRAIRFTNWEDIRKYFG